MASLMVRMRNKVTGTTGTFAGGQALSDDWVPVDDVPAGEALEDSETKPKTKPRARKTVAKK